MLGSARIRRRGRIRAPPHPGTAADFGCELRGVLAPAIGPGGETPPELAGEDARGTGAVRGCALPPPFTGRKL